MLHGCAGVLPRIVLSIALVACSGSASEPAPQGSACERYRDHAIDLHVRGVAEGTLSDDDKAIHRRQIAAAAGPALLTKCAALSENRQRCAMAASSPRQFEECVTPPSE
jgi:hypothetical protein